MSVRVLTPDQCRTLLGSRQVGRVVYTENALPSAFPVTYALDGARVVFRTEAAGRLAATAAKERVVAFQVDAIDETARSGWSVLAIGVARQITEPAAVAAASRLGVSAWEACGAVSVLVEISLERVDGQAVLEAALHAGPRRAVQQEP